jgi:putative glycerol-1-phosphate prenyltransferase
MKWKDREQRLFRLTKSVPGKSRNKIRNMGDHVKTDTYNRLLVLCAERPAYGCLLDPDRQEPEETLEQARTCQEAGADVLLIGGSLMLNQRCGETLRLVHERAKVPVIIFPGLYDAISPHADAIFFLSLVSGRNAQLLIGEQVRAAPVVRATGLEAIGTAYMLVESGRLNSAQFMSGSYPLPRHKPDIALVHALAAQYLGMKMVYMDAGSGADEPISDEMIHTVRSGIDIPLVVGGGIRTPEAAQAKAAAGADFIITGTAIEGKRDPGLIHAFAEAIHSVRR